MTTKQATCPIHHRPLVVVSFCPACRGARGGRVKSDRKAVTSALNAQLGGRPPQAKRRRSTGGRP